MWVLWVWAHNPHPPGIQTLCLQGAASQEGDLEWLVSEYELRELHQYPV